MSPVQPGGDERAMSREEGGEGADMESAGAGGVVADGDAAAALPMSPRRAKRQGPASPGGCCASKPVAHGSASAAQDELRLLGRRNRQSPRAAPATPERSTSRDSSGGSPAATPPRSASSAPLSPEASSALREEWAAGHGPPILLGAKVTGSEDLPTGGVGWTGQATATHYRITGTVRRGNGSESTFTTSCRYSMLHELHTRMSHDRLGVDTFEERQALQEGFALFPEKSWLGGDFLVASREIQLATWLNYWVHLSKTIKHSGHTVEVRNSSVARCSALLCEYLNDDSEQQDRIETSLRERRLSVSTLPLSARKHPSKPRRNSRVAAAQTEDVQIVPTTASSQIASAAAVVELKVQIRGLRSTVGALRLLVWDSQQAWLQEDSACFQERYDLLPSHVADNSFEVLLPALPTTNSMGEYSMMAVHDLKDLGTLDTNMLGIPRDGVCCSNGASGGPGGGPKWSQAKIFPNQRSVLLDMQYIFKMTKEEKRQTVKQSSVLPESSPAASSTGDDMLLIPSANVDMAASGDMASAAAGEMAGEADVSADALREAAPPGQNDAAITDWHWHSSKWEARAARTTLNAQGGYDGSEDHPGFGTEAGPDFRPPTEELSDPYIDNYIAAQQLPHSEWPGTGTRNHNVVVYRANMVSETEWDTQDPIDMFWFDIAPVGSSSIENHRKSNQLDDFIPFGLFDAKGFGMTFDPYWRSQGQTVASMVAMPSSLFPDGTVGASGSTPGRYGLLKPGQFKLVYVPEAKAARLVIVLHGVQCYAEKMYVSTRERKFNPIPKVMYVRLFGIDIETGEHRHEDYYP